MKSSGSVAKRTDKEGLGQSERKVADDCVRADLERVLEFGRTEAQKLPLHEVERQVFARVMRLGRLLLLSVLAERGDGRVAKDESVVPGTASLPLHSTKTRGYLSIFGEIEISRAYYWRVGEAGVCPLDAELQLPEERYSYLLQEWGELLGTDGSFEKVTARLETLLGVKFWSQGVQRVAHLAAEDVQAFYEQKPTPAKETEGELLVATVDGKGVPVRREDEDGRRQLRVAPGKKPNRKREAVVSAVYTVEPHRRTAEDVLREIDDRGCVVPNVSAAPPRPRPKNKRLRATMHGKDAAFPEIRRQLDERDPTGTKTWIALTDGADALQERVYQHLTGPNGIVLVLDVMHVLGYLWPVAFTFFDDGIPEASRWVMNKLRLLLEGKVGYVIGSLRRRLDQGGLSKNKQRDFEKAIRYMVNNRPCMAYDEYLAKGYPIASGVAEGACKNLVKDRMECTGMRWTLPGAQAILDLRSVSLNGDWQAFWRFHVAQRTQQLYGRVPDALRAAG